MNLTYRVMMAIIAVHELRRIRLRGDDGDTINAAIYAYWGLIDALTNEAGITRKDIYREMTKHEYDHRSAVDILDGYELWAQHIFEKNTDGDEHDV